MTAIHEFGQALRIRRTQMGLSQARVAGLSGLSRQTINQIESGSVPDIGINKAERLASVMGLGLRVDTGQRMRPPQRKPRSPLARAAATASVSYRTPLSAATLGRILESEHIPTRYVPHVHALLDDAPVSLLAAVAGQLEQEKGIPQETVWAHYRRLAGAVQSLRDLWV